MTHVVTSSVPIAQENMHVSAPDLAETAIANRSQDDFVQYATEYTTQVVEGSQAVEAQVTADFAETVSNQSAPEHE